MLVISLEDRLIDYQTDLGHDVRAWRGFAEIEFRNENGNEDRLSAFIDTGAPFSVIPYPLWHDHQMVWQLLGTQLLLQGVVVAKDLKWFNVSCQLGETSFSLVDPATRQSTSPLRIVAKFPTVPLGPVQDSHILLGCNFIADNNLTFLMQGAAGQLKQVLLVP